ncbi:hypothetical protein N7456_007392 [Penicillium angulare]|uniref:Uncharacterized protein n=1 Tax=Penicillium angulare TaxID=116970 RepID=A0A9W9FAP8_9EURO|nr:hypothetical protein N7456_007392 [Penicillium angulare]
MTISFRKGLFSGTNDQEGQDVNSQLVSEACSSETPLANPTRKQHDWSWWRSIIMDSWALEIVSMLFSIACFIAIVSVLIVFNGKKRPNISYNLSLNTIVSILATASKSSLVFAIGEAISQLKWDWFQDCKELISMQMFDDASRGPLGSIMLLGHHRGRSVVSFGAAILVFMLVFDPFFQQILSYPTESIKVEPQTGNTAGLENAAFAPQTKYFNSANLSDSEWNGASYLGIWSSDFSIQPQCPSGNCTWPTYKSLGMCSKCADLTSVARLDCPTSEWDSSGNATVSYSGKCEVVLPQGSSSATTITLNVVDGAISNTDIETAMIWEVYRLEDDYDNMTYMDINRPQLVLAEASLGLHDNKIKNDSMVPGIYIEHVTECALSYCIQDYNLSVHGGDTIFQRGSGDFGQVLTLNESLTTPGYLCWAPTGTPSTLGIYATTIGNESIGMNTSAFVFCNWDVQSRPAPVNAARILQMGLNVAMEQTAAAWTQMGLQNTDITIVGTMYSTEVMVKVQWLWMILPALLVLGGNVFLTLTILRSRKKAAWKSSVLALLFHGLRHLDRDEYLTNSAMKKAAENIHVKLQYCDSDRRAMLNEQ